MKTSRIFKITCSFLPLVRTLFRRLVIVALRRKGRVKSPLASSIEGEWNNYKMEQYRDGKVVHTWEVDTNVKFSKDGRTNHSNPESTYDGYYLLI